MEERNHRGTGNGIAREWRNGITEERNHEGMEEWNHHRMGNGVTKEWGWEWRNGIMES